MLINKCLVRSEFAITGGSEQKATCCSGEILAGSKGMFRVLALESQFFRFALHGNLSRVMISET